MRALATFAAMLKNGRADPIVVLAAVFQTLSLCTTHGSENSRRPQVALVAGGVPRVPSRVPGVPDRVPRVFGVPGVPGGFRPLQAPCQSNVSIEVTTFSQVTL